MITDETQPWWVPQPGPQAEAFLCPADELMSGGERGGGKTQLIIGREVIGAQQHGLHWNGIIFRKKYKDFKEIRLDFDRLISKGLPARRIGGENQVNFIKYQNGAVTTLAQAGSLSAVEDWQGNQFVHVSIDEAQQFPYLTAMMSVLKGSMRSPHGIAPRMLLTGNPGGPGASQIKEMFIPVEYGGNEDNPPEGRVHMVDVEQEDGTVGTISRVFIQLPLLENRILLDGDPGYLNRLRAIADSVLRAAWLDGRWDVHVGQAFNFGKHNILDEEIWPIPEHVPIYMTFDWGWGAPFSVQWWWVDGEGRIYMFHEWYGCQKNLPNKGIKLTDPEIAEGILEREQKMGILGRVKKRLAGPDCFKAKPNYKGHGQGAATSDEFRAYCKRPEVRSRYGEKVELDLRVGDATRETKLRQFRTRIRPLGPGIPSMLMVYPHCKHTIRTVPSLVVDEVNPEEIEDLQEDHCFDSMCHIVQEFPMGVSDDVIQAEIEQKKKKQQRARLDEASLAALDEWERTVEQLVDEEESCAWLLDCWA